MGKVTLAEIISCEKKIKKKFALEVINLHNEGN